MDNNILERVREEKEGEEFIVFKIKKKKKKERKGTYTITFSEMVENHVGMEKIGTISQYGFSLSNLKSAYEKFKEAGANVELIDLRVACNLSSEYEVEDAYLLVVNDGCSILGIDPDLLYREQNELSYDTKALMRGRVVNKKARHNLCFSDYKSYADFESGKGTVVDFKSLPYLSQVREKIPDYLRHSRNLYAEGNYYYNVRECYIGFHGDAERKKVVGIRLGETFPLHYRYYLKSQVISDTYSLSLRHGSLYVMSEKTTGNDWKKKLTVTLRHAAGPPNKIENF